MTKVHDMFELGQEEHQSPVGGSFAPSAWIAPFMAGHLYAVGWVEMDLTQLVKDMEHDLPTCLADFGEGMDKPWAEVLRDESEQLFDEASESRSGKWKYFFRDYDRAVTLCQLLNEEEPAFTKAGKEFKRKPEHRFRLETAVADVLTLAEESKEKFERSVVSWEVELKAPRKNSPDWFNWHGLLLPSLVNAYATHMGWEAGFDISELLRPEDEVIVTDQFQEEMIGNRDVGIEQSKLWLRRKLLWQKLGEDNPKASNPDDTESGNLKAALSVASRNWQKPVYCQIVRVPSPKVGDTWEGQQGRVRSTVPVVLEFYPDKVTAQKAAGELLAARGGGDDEGSAPVSGPAVPEAWKDMPDDWKQQVGQIKAEIGKKPLPVVKKELEGRKEQLASDLMVTPGDVLAWWGEVE